MDLISSGLTQSGKSATQVPVKLMSVRYPCPIFDINISCSNQYSCKYTTVKSDETQLANRLYIYIHNTRIKRASVSKTKCMR